MNQTLPSKQKNTLFKFLLKKNQPGFTMVEMFLVIGVIAFLMGFILPAVRTYQKRSNIKQTQLALTHLRGSIDAYHDDTDQYPNTLTDLITQPDNVKNWTSPYAVKKALVDKWNNQFIYEVTPDGDHPYELYSYGPDGKKTPKNRWLSAWTEK